MSDEQRRDDEAEVEGHWGKPLANDETEVEGHWRRHGANDEPAEEGQGEDEVEGHIFKGL